MEDSSDTNWVVHGSSTTSPVENTKRKEVKISPMKLLFLLFWVKGKFGDPLFTEAPKTRMHNIKNSNWFDENIHEVHCPDIEDLSDILNIIPRYIEKFGGKSKIFIKEVSINSHAGQDGPIGSVDNPKKFSFNTSTEAGQMKMEGWQSIDFNWYTDGPRFVIYGCDSALEHPSEDHPKAKNFKSFAKILSTSPNFKDVEVWGQSTKSVPSFLPDYRVTSLDRGLYSDDGRWIEPGWKIGHTYQIAAHMHGGTRATLLRDAEYLPESLRKHVLTPAEDMHCYKNGVKIRSTNQGYFNDHWNKT